MRRCLLATRRLVDKALEKLGEMPESKTGTQRTRNITIKPTLITWTQKEIL